MTHERMSPRPKLVKDVLRDTRSLRVLADAVGMRGCDVRGEEVDWARLALVNRAADEGRTPRRQLLRVKGGGNVTATRVLVALRLDPDVFRPHACVCRQCGRAMGART